MNDNDTSTETQNSSQRQLLALAEFCRDYNQSRSVAYKLISSWSTSSPPPPTALRAVKVGRRTFIPVEEAEAWKARLPEFSPDQQPMPRSVGR